MKMMVEKCSKKEEEQIAHSEKFKVECEHEHECECVCWVVKETKKEWQQNQSEMKSLEEIHLTTIQKKEDHIYLQRKTK